MPNRFYELHGVRVLECAAEETRLRTDRDAVDLIGKSFENRATVIVIPVECFDDDFFRLRTRIAGEIVQKFVNYQRRLVIVGDISRHLDGSSALRAFVNEANRGKDVWFLATREELDRRLALAV
jgi:uncharacterized protein DUF4180